jgi:hypothetical protein
MSRPFGVVFIAVLLIIGAVYNIIIGFTLMFAPLRLTDIAGAELKNIPTFWLIVSGILSVILGLMYFWLSKLALVGSQTAYMLVNFLAILNIMFSLFSLPFGWGMLILNVIVLIAVNTNASKAWLSQTA